jgi:YVTN family beta-propeller protein
MDQTPRDEDNKLLALDADTGEIVKIYELGGEIEQFGISPDGREIYVAMEEAGTAAFCDAETGEVEDSVVAGIEAEGIAVSPDGRKLYVCDSLSNTVTVVDVSTRVTVGDGPWGVTIRRAGS